MKSSENLGGYKSRAARGHVLYARQASMWTRWVAFWATLVLICPAESVGIFVTPQVIPIYGRGSEFDPRQAEAINVKPVPPRPAGQRPTVVQVRAPLSN